ncbi:MAG: hypothetical protein RM338_06625 [Nostoc sp. DedQUE12a]|nr:hypothetical protein [Nostoc sp. DedQUE12a]
MKKQNLRQSKNASSQLTVRVASRREGIASSNRESAIARSSAHPIEELQGEIGNRAVNQLLANQPTVQTKPMFRGLSEELRASTPIQTKLAINAVGDKYEQGEVIQRTKQVKWGKNQTKIFDPDKSIEEEEIARIVKLSRQESKRQEIQIKKIQKEKEEERRNAINKQIAQIQERNKNLQ